MSLIQVAPPNACTWNATHTAVTMNFGIASVSWLLPVDVVTKPMGWFLSIFSGGAPAITFDGVIHTTTSLPYLPGETIVHECVHNFQQKRMGTWSYKATYLYQIIPALFKGGLHWHDTHIMEVEARTVAATVIDKCYVIGQPLDINSAIKQVTGWQA